jgi:hypothetical protein
MLGIVWLLIGSISQGVPPQRRCPSVPASDSRSAKRKQPSSHGDVEEQNESQAEAKSKELTIVPPQSIAVKFE